MQTKSTRISSEELAKFATQGVNRAQEAHLAAEKLLSAEEIEQVSGGCLCPPPVSLVPPIIRAGGIPPVQFLNKA